MKIKRQFILMTLLIVIVAFTCMLAAINQDNYQRQNIEIWNSVNKDNATIYINEQTEEVKPLAISSNHKLPSSLLIIEDGAFEGTALVSVDIPETVTHIGNNAFANISTLLSVKIPDTIQYISEDTFVNSKNVVLIASSNSYAYTWAKSNGFRFQFPAFFIARDENNQFIYPNKRNTYFFAKERTEITDIQRINNRERRNGRSIGELKASQNKGVSGLYIQSRYFP